MSLFAAYRRLVVSSAIIGIPLLTLLTAESVAQMRLAATMTDTATRLLAAFPEEQKARFHFSFETLERYNWHYIPRMRKGVALREMTPAQKTVVLELLRTGLSASGYETAQQIMRLERILMEREKNGSMPMVRDPENYYVSIFGTPSRERPWGWRIEGHHISVNFTVAGRTINDSAISNTPLFFGAEPAEVQGGPLKGLRVLGAAADTARALIDALDAQQRSTAILGTKLPTDIMTGNDRAPDLGSQLNPIGLDRQPEALTKEGLPASRMTAQQKQLLRALIDVYVSRMPDDIAAMRTREIAASLDEIRFAWIGATRAEDAPKPTPSFGCVPGDQRWECIPLGFPYYYRVHSPTFLIEYINPNGNHAHSVWRDYQDGDFGEDLLRAHYAEVPHDGFPGVPVLAAGRRGTYVAENVRRARPYAAPGGP
jgi:hypothetical protein